MTKKLTEEEEKIEQEKLDRFSKLVDARIENQNLMLLLYKSNNKALKPYKRDIFNYLIGATFSLWRAANLIDGKRKRGEVKIKARDLLEKLIADNAIGYYQDKELRKWMSGYYMNNTHFRLIGIKKIIEDNSVTAKVDFAQIENLSGEDKDSQQWEYWNQLHKILLDIYHEIFPSVKKMRKDG